MEFWNKYSRPIVLLLALGAGILITLPNANFQDYLSQGDHGRDLYAAEAVYRGEMPYRDFWWVYGPLMPYYYGLFFKAFGIKISSMILGKLLLRILAGILVCLAMMEVASEAFALLCACWFMLFQQDFFFTYNHMGGIAMVVGVAFCLLSYIKNNSLKSAWGALGFIFILCVIKVNFGLAALTVSVITVGVCDFVRRIPVDGPKKLFFSAALIGVPLVTFIIYWSMLQGLTSMEIRQCLPYKEGDQPYTMPALTAIGIFCKGTFHTISSNWTNLIFALIINISTLRCIYIIAKKKLPAARSTVLMLSLGMLGLFYVANFHEYLKSGVWYRAYWSQPLSILMIFLLIDTALKASSDVSQNGPCFFSILDHFLLGLRVL